MCVPRGHAVVSSPPQRMGPSTDIGGGWGGVAPTTRCTASGPAASPGGREPRWTRSVSDQWQSAPPECAPRAAEPNNQWARAPRARHASAPTSVRQSVAFGKHAPRMPQGSPYRLDPRAKEGVDSGELARGAFPLTRVAHGGGGWGEGFGGGVGGWGSLGRH